MFGCLRPNEHLNTPLIGNHYDTYYCLVTICISFMESKSTLKVGLTRITWSSQNFQLLLASLPIIWVPLYYHITCSNFCSLQYEYALISPVTIYEGGSKSDEEESFIAGLISHSKSLYIDQILPYHRKIHQILLCNWYQTIFTQKYQVTLLKAQPIARNSIERHYKSLFCQSIPSIIVLYSSYYQQSTGEYQNPFLGYLDLFK